MNTIVQQMLKRYNCVTESDTVNAVREIMQELALQRRDVRPRRSIPRT